MIDYNYHTHTFRCGHAFGTEREYVENAISLGIKVLGFSDHILLRDKSDELREKFEDYIHTINLLKEEYKDKIEIHLGFEAEYIESRLPFYKEILETGKVEYLILGQHYNYFKGKEAFIGSNVYKSKIQFVRLYMKNLKKACKSGLFVYIAHPDMIIKAFDEVTPKYLKYCRKICKLAKRYNMPLEINLNGWKNHYKHMDEPTFYPNEDFFKIAGEIGNDVIIGVDAHESDFWFKAKYDWAESVIKKYNLHEITRLSFEK